MSNGTSIDKIKILVEKYRELVRIKKVGDYNEEETKIGFILPLFEALGWDINNKYEVSSEEQQSGGRVDHGFYLNGRAKFYLEAKSLKVDLDREEFAKQAIRYSWNKGVTWAILTDFEGLKVFNAQVISESLGNKLFFEIKWDEYLNRIDQLSLLSRDSMSNGLLDKEAEKYGKKLKMISVGASLYKDLKECRDILTKSLSIWNPKVDGDLLDEGVQKLLDRLIFIRVVEDRGVEEEILIPMIRQWKPNKGQVTLFKTMISKFRELDEIYNSNLFSPHPFEDWAEFNNDTEKVVEILYGKKGYYEYDFKVIPSDVLGAVYENYLGYRLSKSKKGLSINKDSGKRKEQGIYYTPSYIVDYIVENALKPVLDTCTGVEQLKKIKVLDPACGSGSFLIKALDMIYKKYVEFGYNNDEENTKIQILSENIYGVDLDHQAIEIARLNLLISTLKQKIKLPSLTKNIKNGNSLISGTDEELKKYFGNNFRDKKPFNWEQEFPEVFKQGGFDVIIGNPPYINSRNLDGSDKNFLGVNFKSASDQYDLYSLFVEKSINLLHTRGCLGFIIPNKFLVTKYGLALRKYIIENSVLTAYKDCSTENVFMEANVYPVVIVLKKETKSVSLDGKYDLLRTFGVTGINKIIQKIDSISNRVILKVWRPIATATEIEVGNDIIITNREIGRYVLAETRIGKLSKSREEDSCKNKIILKKLCFNLEAGIDYKGLFTVNTTYCILVPEHDVNMEYVLGILNSKLLTYFVRNEYSQTALRGGYIELRVYQIQILPIIRVAQDKQRNMVRYVKDIIKLEVKIKDYEINSEKWKSIKSEMEKVDKMINEEVYQLYSITDTEKEIIENSSKS